MIILKGVTAVVVGFLIGFQIGMSIYMLEPSAVFLPGEVIAGAFPGLRAWLRDLPISGIKFATS